jgi:putative heme-binding domain-containing protein
VDGLVKRLATAKGAEFRRGILGALCRLHFIEGKWDGASWGTRPDYRGPYYQPEPWGETDKIAGVLKATLAGAQPEEAAFLAGELNRNRIQFNEALQRLLELAKSDGKVIPDLAIQLAGADAIPVEAVPLLIQAARSTEFSAAAILHAVTALSKVDSAEGARASLEGVVRLAGMSGASKEREAARNAFLNAPKLENHHQMLEDIAEKMDGKPAQWADAALLTLSSRKTGAPESRELSAKALDAGWQNARRRAQILRAAGEIKHGPYADKILAALDDPDKAVADEAKSAAGKMRLTKSVKDSGPLIGTMQVKDVIAQVLNTKGDAALGEQLFTRQTCAACHTVSQDQAQKGPYLGNIAQTYKRPDLAENILDPNKTIAQGFVTNVFTLKSGEVNMGFVVREGSDKVTVRNVASQESTYEVKDIVKRETLPTSIMPPGLVNSLTVREFASLLDYLEALAAKKQ